MPHVVVLVTVGSADEAERIGQAVVREKLAACANLVPSISTTYWWQGAVEHAAEALLILKTRGEHLDILTRRVRELHSYTVPEIIALPIVGGHADYLRWIDDSVQRPGSAGSSGSA